MIRVRLLILVGLAGLIFLGSKYLTIQVISCQVDGSACPPDVYAELSRNYGQSVSGVRPAEIEEKLLKADFRLKSAKVGLRFPLTLKAELKTRVPVIQVIPSNNSIKGLLVDNQGRIIGEREAGELPLIIWDEVALFRPGNDLPPEFVAFIPVLLEIDVRFNPVSAEVSNGMVIFYLPEKIKVKFPAPGSTDKLEALQLLVNQARIGNQPVPKEIDLRFNYPVIKN
jgi:hypothetical protein